jgi:hypothetical protein
VEVTERPQVIKAVGTEGADRPKRTSTARASADKQRAKSKKKTSPASVKAAADTSAVEKE